MSSIFDRLNQEIEQFGKKAQAALDEGKLQIERLRMKRQQDEAARDLGRLIHRRERGQQVDQLEVDSFLVRLDTIEATIARIDREIASAKGETVSVSVEPAPASTPNAGAEVNEG
jgi:hypothetical protein